MSCSFSSTTWEGEGVGVGVRERGREGERERECHSSAAAKHRAAGRVGVSVYLEIRLAWAVENRFFEHLFHGRI